MYHYSTKYVSVHWTWLIEKQVKEINHAQCHPALLPYYTQIYCNLILDFGFSFIEVQWIKVQSGKMTCGNSGQLGKELSVSDLGHCKASCVDNSGCNGIFFVTDSKISNNCILYSRCDSTRNTTYVGETYHKGPI